MRNLMKKTTLLVLMLLWIGSAADAQVSVGIRIGPPPAPRALRAQPRRPGPEFVWIEGYWYPVANHYKWHNGYWTRPPYAGARWVAPRHDGREYFAGYWEGDRGRLDHDHRWDRSKARDSDRRDRNDDRRDRR